MGNVLFWPTPGSDDNRNWTIVACFIFGKGKGDGKKKEAKSEIIEENVKGSIYNSALCGFASLNYEESSVG